MRKGGEASPGVGDPDPVEQVLGPMRARPAGSRARCVSTASAIWSPTRSTGFSDVMGSWNTIAISLPRS